MKGLENPDYLLMFIVSNIVGLFILWAGYKNPKLARFIFFLLFGWACWINYSLAHNNPEAYLNYATISTGWYADFINGWFSQNITFVVTATAIGQGLIALGMLLKGWWVRMACIGVIIFLIGIAPLGVGSAFPFSVTVGLASYFILRRDNLEYIWEVGWPNVPSEMKKA
jgi:hypothetical protein